MTKNKNLNPEERVANSFYDMQTSLSITSTQSLKIGFLFDNENQYNLYRNMIHPNYSDNNNLDFLQVTSHLLSISSQLKENYIKMADFQEKYHLGKLNLRPSIAEKEYNKLLNTVLVNLCTSLSKTGFIDTLLSKHNKKCAQYHVNVLKLTPEQIEHELDKNKRCNTTDSYVKLAFCSNKFIKFINSIEEASIYHLSTSNMNHSNLTETEINKLLYIARKKKSFLTSIYLNSYNAKQESLYLNLYKDKYSELLKDTFINSNDLEQEYRFLRLFESTKNDVYTIKDQLSNTLITDCLIDHKTHKAAPYIKNWGIIEDFKDKSKCIFGIHLPRNLFPCAFHLPKYSLYETMRFLKVNAIDIPKYDISEHFITFTGELFPINIIASPSEEQVNALKNICKYSKTHAPILDTIHGHLAGHSYISYDDTIHFELR